MKWCSLKQSLFITLNVTFLFSLLFWYSPSPLDTSGYVSNAQPVDAHPRPALLNVTSTEPVSMDILPCPKDLHTDRERMRAYERIPQLSPLSDISEAREYSEKILILTPVSNSVYNLQHYFSMICTLSYPHSLISVALGEDSSTDNTYKEAHAYATKLHRKHFRRAEVFRLSDKLKSIPKRHTEAWQLRRRSHLAKSRNQLLQYGLEDEDWVLWIDSDVKYIPPDLIQHLLSAQEDVVATSCLSMGPGVVVIYDFNSWQETEDSLKFLASQEPNYLMLEGYGKTRRKFLGDLKEEGRKVPLDGVGGCALFVRADCHRNGLTFPTFVFEHHIETEGLAKLAKKMNYTVFGLPSVNVYH